MPVIHLYLRWPLPSAVNHHSFLHLTFPRFTTQSKHSTQEFTSYPRCVFSVFIFFTNSFQLAAKSILFLANIISQPHIACHDFLPLIIRQSSFTCGFLSHIGHLWNIIFLICIPTPPTGLFARGESPARKITRLVFVVIPQYPFAANPRKT